MQFYTYIYHDERMIPYYVGQGSRRRYVDRHRVPVPPKARILIQHWESQEKAYEMERWWIALYGRRDIGTGCLMNRTDGGPGHTNPGPVAMPALVESGRRVQPLGARLGALAHTFEQRSRAGKANTFANRSRAGQIGIRLMTVEQRSTGGQISGRNNVITGHLARLRTSEHQRMAARAANHTRWHTNRGIINSECLLCQ